MVARPSVAQAGPVTSTGTDSTGTAGPLLLLGGAEMRPGGRDTDLAFLAAAGEGPLVVLLAAATPGADHERSSRRARRYHEELGSGREVVVAPHPQEDLDGCLDAVGAAAVVVLPGGSPVRLLDGLRLDGGRLGRALVERHRAGAALSGSSAGAMVLCARAAQPDRGRGDGLVVEDGLGLVPGLAVVHDDGSDGGRWADPADPDGVRWGLPEQGGVLVHRGTVRAVGARPVRLWSRGSARPVPADAVPLEGLLAGG